MSQVPLAESASQVIDAWTYHFEQYAECKDKIAKLRATNLLLESKVANLEQRMARVKAKHRTYKGLDQASVQREIQALTKDIEEDRRQVLQSRVQIDELEQKLEKTWDIW